MFKAYTHKSINMLVYTALTLSYIAFIIRDFSDCTYCFFYFLGLRVQNILSSISVYPDSCLSIFIILIIHSFCFSIAETETENVCEQ